MKIDILVKPDEDCGFIERMITTSAKNLNLSIRINKTTNFAAFSNISVNPTQTPVVIINGVVEFTGKNIDAQLVRKKLAEIGFT